MQNNPIGWFEIPVTDMPRAIAFYETVFGKKLDLHSMGEAEMAWFPMDGDSYGSTGTLIKSPAYKPSQDGVLIYFTTPSGDLTQDEKTIEQHGGKILVPKMSIGEHGFISIFLDTEGNRIALHSMS